jgi:hypothetical protein
MMHLMSENDQLAHYSRCVPESGKAVTEIALFLLLFFTWLDICW